MKKISYDKYDEINETICPNRYLNSIDYEAAKILAELETRAVAAGATIIGGSFCNAYLRSESDQSNLDETKMPRVPESYLIYLLDGYRCEVMLDRASFWVFDGPRIIIEKLEDGGTYHRRHYPINFKIKKGNLESFFTSCLDPAATCAKQKLCSLKTRSDKDYVKYTRHTEPKFYLF